MPLFGQAGRQIFFILTSIYGWWRWSQRSRAAGEPVRLRLPRWRPRGERVFFAAGGHRHRRVQAVCVTCAARRPTRFFTPQWWFYWCDAWIFVGSMVATYAMARGWIEFWLGWIAVDLVGVPFGFATGYVPTAVLYTFYGAFVLYGFSQWVKVSREERPRGIDDPAVETVA